MAFKTQLNHKLLSAREEVQLAQRMEGWKIEIDEQLESLRAFELF